MKNNLKKIVSSIFLISLIFSGAVGVNAAVSEIASYGEVTLPVLPNDSLVGVNSSTHRLQNVTCGTGISCSGGTITSTGGVPSLTAGSVLFSGGGTTVSEDNANFFYDFTNHNLKLANDLLIDGTGSTTTNPRTINFTNFNVGEAARYSFGDPLNSLQASFGGKIQLQSYWGIDINGNRQSGSTLGFVTGAGTDASLRVNGTTTTAPVFVVQGAASQSGDLQRWANSVPTILSVVNSIGNFGIRNTSPTAYLHLGAGTATANTAPLKFTSGTNLTSPVAGAVEYDGTQLYFSPSTTRDALIQDNGTRLTSGRVPIATTNGYLNDDSDLTFATDTLTGTKIIATTTLTASGGMKNAYVAKTGTYSITTSDYLIDCTANTFTVTLPTAVGITGQIFEVKNSGAGTITIATTSSQTIDGVTTKTISTQYNFYQVMSNGANWIVIGS